MFIERVLMASRSLSNLPDSVGDNVLPGDGEREGERALELGAICGGVGSGVPEGKCGLTRVKWCVLMGLQRGVLQGQDTKLNYKILPLLDQGEVYYL